MFEVGAGEEIGGAGGSWGRTDAGDGDEGLVGTGNEDEDEVLWSDDSGDGCIRGEGVLVGVSFGAVGSGGPWWSGLKLVNGSWVAAGIGPG